MLKVLSSLYLVFVLLGFLFIALTFNDNSYTQELRQVKLKYLHSEFGLIMKTGL